MQAGTTLGQYRITGSLGTGGMGAVFSAQHTLIGRAAAVKLLHPELSNNPEVVTRFFNEARAAAAVRHPGIVEIYDFGWNTEGAAYIVMEQLQGESLATRLARGRMSLATAAMIVRQIAGALAAVHRIGIVHRDLKPDNVFLVPDAEMANGERIKLLDFGIAKLVADHDQHRMTRPGAVLGTPTYMAPEQCVGARVDHRADLYSLGCILFELCTGHPPFVGDSLAEIFQAHVNLPAPALSSHIAGAPAELDRLVRDLLLKDPARRPASADAVVRAIDVASGGGASSAAFHALSPTAATRLQPRLSTLSGAIIERPAPPASPHRHRWLGVSAIAVAAATLGAVLSGALLRRIEHASPAAAMAVQAEPPPPARIVSVPATPAPVAPLSAAPAAKVASAPVTHAVATVHPATARATSRPRKPVTEPAVSVPPPPSASASATDSPPPIAAASLTDLYVGVGRKLKVLEDGHGAVATEDLWPAFRRIHIQDAILDVTRRGEIEHVLQQLDDLATQRSTAP